MPNLHGFKDVIKYRFLRCNLFVEHFYVKTKVSEDRFIMTIPMVFISFILNGSLQSNV